jgi:mono/diheme cytochrome c family protein
MARYLLTSVPVDAGTRRQIMRNATIVVWVALCLGVAVASPASRAAAEPPADGKALFVEMKCTKCHSAPEIKGGKGDLTGVGKKRTPDWIAKWLKKEEAIDGKKHKKAFTGTPAQMDAVVKWLSTLK